MQALLTVVFVLLGLAVGSFLNVCIDRLPSGRPIVTPPSRCDQGQRRLAVLDLIPVFSFVWQRGRCRYCGVALPKRLVAVELVSGMMLGILYLVFGLEPEFGVRIVPGSRLNFKITTREDLSLARLLAGRKAPRSRS